MVTTHAFTAEFPNRQISASCSSAAFLLDCPLLGLYVPIPGKPYITPAAPGLPRDPYSSQPSLCMRKKRGSPKIRDTILGVSMNIAFWLYIGVPLFGKLPNPASGRSCRLRPTSRASSFDAAWGCMSKKTLHSTPRSINSTYIGLFRSLGLGLNYEACFCSLVAGLFSSGSG